MIFLLYILLGAAAGLLAGLFGVGGGMIIVPVLIFAFTAQGFDASVLTHMAVGTSLATILFTSVNAVREHHSRGAVRWGLFVWLTVGIVLGSALGALTAESIDGLVLQKIIGVFALAWPCSWRWTSSPKPAARSPARPASALLVA